MALEQTRIENLFDSNVFSAYIPRELPILHIDDPRQTQWKNQKFYSQWFPVDVRTGSATPH